MGRSLLAGLVFFAIFIAGGVAGYFFGFGWARRLQEAGQKARQQQQQQAIAVPFGPMVLHRFAEQLNLTDEQRKQLRPIVLRYADELRVLNGERENALQRMQEEVDKILTFDQRVKLQKLKDEQQTRLLDQQERVRRFLLNRGGKGWPQGAPRNPPAAPPSPPAQSAPAAPAPSPQPTAMPPTQPVPEH